MREDGIGGHQIVSWPGASKSVAWQRCQEPVGILWLNYELRAISRVGLQPNYIILIQLSTKYSLLNHKALSWKKTKSIKAEYSWWLVYRFDCGELCVKDWSLLQQKISSHDDWDMHTVHRWCLSGEIPFIIISIRICCSQLSIITITARQHNNSRAPQTTLSRLITKLFQWVALVLARCNLKAEKEMKQVSHHFYRHYMFNIFLLT